MIAGLPQAFDVSALPLGARIAQVVLAGTAVTFAASRAINARADLMLVVEMVEADLADDLRAHRLPGLDPQVIQVQRTLVAAQRLSPASIAHQAVRRGAWWEPAQDTTSGLTASQQSRLDGYLDQLDAAVATYRLATRPWWRFALSSTPRHVQGNQQPRTLHASATQREGRGRKRSRADQAVQRAARTAPPSSGIPMPRPFERNLLFDGAIPGSVPEPEATGHLLGDPIDITDAPGQEPARVPAALTKAAAITVAINRSRGIDPAGTQQTPAKQRPAPSRTIQPDDIDLGRTGLGDILQR